MKNLFLSLMLVCLSAVAAKANSVNVFNFLPFPISLNFIGVEPSGVTFQTGYITLTPGPNPFPDPSFMLPGANPSARIVSAFGFCSPYDIAVGGPISGGPPVYQNIPAGNLCNSGSTFDLFWNESPTAPYNVVLVIN
jgi:hypothetical protein